MKYIILFCLLFTPLLYAQGQSLKDYEKVLDNNMVTFHSDDNHKFRFEVKTIKTRPKTDRTYHWYQSRRVHVSQGGYEGKVLHGEWREFYPDNNLASQGAFRDGLKSGKWSTWNENGILIKQSAWKKSEETGPYALFNPEGQRIESGTYKNGLRNGKIWQYDTENNTAQSLYFDHGIETSRENYVSRQPIWKRMGLYLSKQWANLFNKLEK